ncbi:uncharacterized protein CPUR_07091 [Claviceps purpurea 20.1]|uniref:Uncharacterized protein n=1 Tax=Claviceps purpurea (strain 20.1) TaxID=1111077 RepID=M1VXK2_CLAP2|nr:uncharacterized protein CPUR_07091 [Claviceps purpurea 20.1]
MADLIESGRHSYAAKRYRQASQFFSRALDFQAITFEALGLIDEAMKNGEWMLELAPQLPDGYLRVGRIARLQKKYEYAWKIYTTGIEVYKQTDAGSSAKLQKLYDARKPLHRYSLKRNPLCLPAEIVTQIFSYLHFREIIPLWRDITFKKHETQMPRLDLLRKMLLWAGDGGARKIVIPSGMNITQPALTLLLEASPRLEYLKLDWLRGNLAFPSNQNTWDRLMHAFISGSEKTFFHRPAEPPGGFAQMFLQSAASNLEHLTLKPIPLEWYNSVPSIPLLPKLKNLRLHGWQDEGTPLPIYPLSIASPRLEQLCIAAIRNFDPDPVAFRRKESEDIWPHLKVLMYKPDGPNGPDSCEIRTHSTLRYLASLNRGNSLQHIQFEFDWPPRSKPLPDIFGDSPDQLTNSDIFQHAQFQNLRSLRSEKMWISPDRARTLLSNAIKNKKLTSFDIVFPMEEMNERLTADASVRHLKGYDWLCGNPTIHTLGCQDFLFSFNPEDEEGRLLPQFLATFPNLRTLTINSEHYGPAQFAKLVKAILKVTHLKVICTESLGEKELDELEELARSKGTEIQWDCEPRPWPFPLE